MTASLTLGGMFERTSKSSSDAAPVLELSPRADVGDPTGMRGEHLREWRVAANQMVSAYKLLGLAVPEAPRLIEGDGAVEARHFTGLDPAKVRVFADALAPGHAAGFLLVELLWAGELRDAIRDAGGSTIGEGRLDPDAIAEIADELEVVLLLATLRVSPPRSTPPRS